jgi:hypothetical protein
LKETEVDYFTREVLPHRPDAWIDAEKTRIGYDINFNRHFYVYTPPRSLAAIDAELKKAYATAGHPEHWRLLRYDVGHQETPEGREEIRKWLVTYL